MFADNREKEEFALKNNSRLKGAERWILAGLVALHFVVCTHSMWDSSAASDEPDYIGAGRYIVETGNWKFTSALWHPPLSYYLNSLPLFFTDIPDRQWHVTAPNREGIRGWILYDLQVGNELIFLNQGNVLRLARLPGIILSAGLLIVIFLWSRELFGPKAGIGSAFLYSLSPTIIANARFAHTDIPLTFFMTCLFWVLWKLRGNFKWRLFFAGTVFAGGAIGCKVNGLLTIPAAILVLIMLLYKKQSKSAIAGRCVLLLVIPFLILWGLYGFKIGAMREPDQAGTVISILESKTPPALHPLIRGVVSMNVPMPQYAGPIATIVARTDRGDLSYLMGEVGNSGWWYYFPVAFLVKTPVPAVLLIAAGIVFFLQARMSFTEKTILILPILITVLPALATSIQIGVRHILPAYPFLFIIAGAAIARLCLSRTSGIILLLLAAWYIAGAVRIHPSHLSYFNELAGGTEGGEYWLSDSNMDFCEDFIRLAEYQKENGIDSMALSTFAPYPVERYHVRYSPLEGPATGYVAVQVMKQQMARALNPNPLEWLDRHVPVARVGGSIKVYHISEISE